jgi:DNA-binding transcriptional regulator GbsR (MarR family)
MRGYVIPPEGSELVNAKLRAWELLAVDSVGHVIEFWGFKRNQGRVWALLYLRARPFTAAQIQDELGLSKGGVSMITNELERWGVLRRRREPNKDAWSFEAEQDLMRMLTRVLVDRESELVARVRFDLAEAERLARADPRTTAADLERLHRMAQIASLVERSLGLFIKTARLDFTSLTGALTASAKRLRGKK